MPSKISQKSSRRRLNTGSALSSRQEATPASAKVARSTSSTPSVSLRGDAESAETSRILASLVLESEQLSRASIYDDDGKKMIKLTQLNHGLQHTLTQTSSPSYASQVMKTYNLDYVLSVRSLLIYLVMTVLRNLLIYHHLIKSLIILSGKWARTEILHDLNPV